MASKASVEGRLVSLNIPSSSVLKAWMCKRYCSAAKTAYLIDHVHFDLDIGKLLLEQILLVFGSLHLSLQSVDLVRFLKG